MATPAEVVRQYLIDLRLIGDENAGDWASGTGQLPAQQTSDNFVAVSDTGAVLFPKNLRTGDRAPHPTISITVRSLTYPTGARKASDISLALDAVGTLTSFGGAAAVPVEVGDEDYVLQTVTVLAPGPMPIGQEEEKQRYLFVLNARLTMDPDTPEQPARYPVGSFDLFDSFLGYDAETGRLVLFAASSVNSVIGGSGGTSLPPQTGHGGQALFTDGTVPFWQAVVGAVSPVTLTAHNANETPLTIVLANGQIVSGFVVQDPTPNPDGTVLVQLRSKAGGVYRDVFTVDDFGNVSLVGGLTAAGTVTADVVFATTYLNVRLFNIFDKSASPANGQLFVYNQSASQFDPVDRAHIILLSPVVDAKMGGQTVNLTGLIPPNMEGQVTSFKTQIVTGDGITGDAKVTFGTLATPGLFGPSTYLNVRNPKQIYEADGLHSDTVAAGTQLTGTIDIGGTATGLYQVRFIFDIAIWRSLT